MSFYKRRRPKPEEEKCADPAKARAYEALKLELAEKYPDDRAAYTAGKSAFVAKVLDL